MADALPMALFVVLAGAAGGLFLIAVDCTVRAARWLLRGLIGTWRAFWEVPDVHSR